MKALVAWGLCTLVLLSGVQGLAQLRTVRILTPVQATAPVLAPSEPAGVATTSDGEKVEMVMAEIKSEADETTEDGSNDSSAAEAMHAQAQQPAEESIHEHFRRYTKPMQFLPKDHTTLVEVESRAGAGEDGEDEGGSDKGSNPTYILPVDPFNYFPFFNGFSNVNPFSQFYPPPPYLYPQYTNYMHQYANYGAGHPPGYPSPGAYGGYLGAYGQAHAGFPYNYPHPQPHMHYPFGAYKMDVSGPDVRTGANNPPPFPQFAETSAHLKLIKPEIIPRAHDRSEDEEGDFVVASLIETSSGAEARVAEEEEEGDSTEVEFEAEGADESGEAEDVEILDESDEQELTSEHVEYENEEDADNEASDVEYAL